MQSMSKDRVFLENYSKSVSGIMNYNVESAKALKSSKDGKRRLMSIENLKSSNRELMAINDKVLGLMCGSQSALNMQDTIKTPSFDIIVEKFSPSANTSPKKFLARNKYALDSSI